MPLRDIQDKFTKSELIIMGWRSQEQAYKMRLRMKRTPSGSPESSSEVGYEPTTTRKEKKEYSDAEVPEGLPDRLYDEDGEVNLSKGTLQDALKYMAAIGIKMPAPTAGRTTGTARIIDKLPEVS